MRFVGVVKNYTLRNSNNKAPLKGKDVFDVQTTRNTEGNWL